MAGARRASAWLFAAFLLAFSVPLPRYSWNESSRAALVAAAVDHGTFAIDAPLQGPWPTGDRARFQGRYYSDKIIGTALLAAPGYLLAGWIGGHPPPPWLAALCMRIPAETIPGAVGAVLLFLLLVRLRVPLRRAAVATVLSVVGTLWLPYGTSLYPYVAGIALLLAATHLFLLPPRRMGPLVTSLLGGAVLGGALLLDYVFGIAVALLGIARVVAVARDGAASQRAAGPGGWLRPALAHGVALAAGAAPPLALFALYCQAIFGQWAIPYQFLENGIFREGMSRGLMGVGAPSLRALWFLTVHPFRGLFFWSPVVAVAFWGCATWMRDGDPARRAAGLLGLVALPAYLLFNAGYYMWWGGYAAGPRFLIPALPLVLPGLGALATGDPSGAFPWRWGVALVAGAVSVALSIPFAFTGVNVPTRWTDRMLLAEWQGASPHLDLLDRATDFYDGRANPLDWPMAGLVTPGWLGYGVAGLAGLLFLVLVARAVRVGEAATR
ncbi:MAG TPA: hypothetical protein VFM53_07250 [Anaeromyxobacteraceae bacterium]|nr:hypothetical protein [Anaeromyxobacteraceae bacterium]